VQCISDKLIHDWTSVRADRVFYMPIWGAGPALGQGEWGGRPGPINLGGPEQIFAGHVFVLYSEGLKAPGPN
jgi:hypothetical protein